MAPPPIVIVTGANSGVGYGICQRLLVQLSQRYPPDAEPRFKESLENVSTDYEECDGLTLIMACRSLDKAKEAQNQLLAFFNSHVEQQKTKSGYDGFAERFQQNVNIVVERLDLASIHTVFKFSDTVTKRYPYVSHLICNAGLASFVGIDWIKAITQICRSPVAAVTAPEYNYQRMGELSIDGLGYVWQCNVFGHYVLYRRLQSSLQASKSHLGSRVLWMSSLEATPKFFDELDWQLVKTNHSYESSKYQMDLIATVMDRQAREAGGREPRHFVVEPGVSSTKVASALTNFFTDFLRVIAFYIARCLGSKHHTIHPFASAIAAVHIALVSLANIPIFRLFAHPSTDTNGIAQNKPGERPVRFSAMTDFWGRPRVGVTDVKMWQEHDQHAEKLLRRFEGLYQDFQKAEEQGSESS